MIFYKLLQLIHGKIDLFSYNASVLAFVETFEMQL